MVELEESLEGGRSSTLLGGGGGGWGARGGRWGRRVEALSLNLFLRPFVRCYLNTMTSTPFISSFRMIHQSVSPSLWGYLDLCLSVSSRTLPCLLFPNCLFLVTKVSTCCLAPKIEMTCSALSSKV